VTGDAGWLAPEWRIAGVGALMTTRAGGVSSGPYASMNLGTAVGDDPANVVENRRRLAARILARPVFLRQVHGARVVRVDAIDADPERPVQEADAVVTTAPGVACTVQAADCLPVLLAAPEGRAVGAAHAGWRGLAAGVLEATVAAVSDAGRCEPSQLSAWLGACIGPNAFEVGADVLLAFGVSSGSPTDVVPAARRFRLKGGGKWLADLAGLARDRLDAAGLQQVEGGGWCTVGDAARFFSYRRDGTTGRMAAAIWIARG
jgi:purine-nucleoside/S-methyl-5'-thioadenosine phosphorylase / adenosine deaminase